MPVTLALILVAAALPPPRGAPEPGFLGVSVRAAAAGLEVMEVVAGGPCAAAGVRPGDVLSSLDQQRLRSVADLDRALQAAGASRPLIVQLWRGGRQERLQVTLARRSVGAEPGLEAPAARDLRREVRAIRAELEELRALLARLRRGGE